MRTESKEEGDMDPRNSESNQWLQWKKIIDDTWAAGLESNKFKLEKKVWRTCSGKKKKSFHSTTKLEDFTVVMEKEYISSLSRKKKGNGIL